MARFRKGKKAFKKYLLCFGVWDQTRLSVRQNKLASRYERFHNNRLDEWIDLVEYDHEVEVFPGGKITERWAMSFDLKIAIGPTPLIPPQFTQA